MFNQKFEYLLVDSTVTDKLNS